MNRIKELRNLQGMSAQNLADELNIAQSTLSQYENEKREANYDMLYQIARFFNVSIEYLLGFDKQNNPPVSKEQAFSIWFNTLTKEQKIIIDLVLKLTDPQQGKVLAYMQGMFAWVTKS